MRLTRRGALAGACAALAAPAFAETPGGRAIRIAQRSLASFQPSEPSRLVFGRLRYRAGYALSSGAKEFGGFSGLWRSADGRRLVAISDRAHWLAATVSQANGAMGGLSDAVLAPMLNAQGRAMSDTRAYDTEALCIEGGVAFVGVERVQEIHRFDWARAGVAARGQSLPVPAEAKRWPRNRGIEALGVAPQGSPVAGAMVILSERSGAIDEPTAGHIIGGPRPGPFRYQRFDEYDVTDLAFLPGGDMLVLERWYRPWRGVAMRLRRVPGPSLLPGATVRGELICEADMGHEIDNMEGLCVHREDGRTIVTMISDDNFSLIQRTLLLEFELTG